MWHFLLIVYILYRRQIWVDHQKETLHHNIGDGWRGDASNFEVECSQCDFASSNGSNFKTHKRAPHLHLWISWRGDAANFLAHFRLCSRGPSSTGPKQRNLAKVEKAFSEFSKFSSWVSNLDSQNGGIRHLQYLWLLHWNQIWILRRPSQFANHSVHRHFVNVNSGKKIANIEIPSWLAICPTLYWLFLPWTAGLRDTYSPLTTPVIPRPGGTSSNQQVPV